MNIYQQIVNHKLRNITLDELLMYAKQYNISLTREQAKNVTTILRKKKDLNIFNQNERNNLLKEISKATNPQLASQLNSLFLKFTS